VIEPLLLFGLFVAAGATSFQFYRGRKKNLQIMIKTIRELESALSPIDKNYTMLGLYSGFRADYILRDKPKKVVATLGLMPREALWYYPISLLTLKHDRLYIVYYLDTKRLPKLHLVNAKVLGYSGIDVRREDLKEVNIANKTYLAYSTDEKSLQRAVELVNSHPEVLHLAVTPETGVLYVFAKPEPGRIRDLVIKTLSWARALAREGA